MPVTLPRFRPLTIAVAAGVLLAVLYGIITFTVHAPLGIPAELAPLTPAANTPAVPQVAFGGPDGKRHTLAEFQGHYVLLNLWAPWCAPCVQELPALAKLQASLPAGKLDVVAVDVGRGTTADAAQFLAGHGAGLLTAYADSDIALMRGFGAYGLPVSILIDPKGHEIARAVGPAQWAAPQAIGYFQKLTGVP
jgi:thiol-disulfide isomerase/thioredoxin